jgi:hypothetical protein
LLLAPAVGPLPSLQIGDDEGDIVHDIDPAHRFVNSRRSKRVTRPSTSARLPR